MRISFASLIIAAFLPFAAHAETTCHKWSKNGNTMYACTSGPQQQIWTDTTGHWGDPGDVYVVTPNSQSDRYSQDSNQDGFEPLWGDSNNPYSSGGFYDTQGQPNILFPSLDEGGLAASIFSHYSGERCSAGECYDDN